MTLQSTLPTLIILGCLAFVVIKFLPEIKRFFGGIRGEVVDTDERIKELKKKVDNQKSLNKLEKELEDLKRANS